MFSQVSLVHDYSGSCVLQGEAGWLWLWCFVLREGLFETAQAGFEPTAIILQSTQVVIL